MKDPLLRDDGGVRVDMSLGDSDRLEEVDDREDNGDRTKSEEELVNGGDTPDLNGLFIALEKASDGKGMRALEYGERDILSRSSQS